MANSTVNKIKEFFGLPYDEDELLEDELEYENENEDDDYTSRGERHIVSSPYAQNKVLNIHNNANIKIEVFSPKSYEDATVIINGLRSRKPAVVNLQHTSPEVARGVFDFLNGALYAIDGRAEKIEKGIFLMAPKNVQINMQQETKETKDNGVFEFNA